MAKKKIQLSNLKVKSFVTVMSKSEQKTAKGGLIDQSANFINFKGNWTTIKTQKNPHPIAKIKLGNTSQG